MQLSDDFLMNLALGNRCIIYDFGANKEVPRAIWQGLEFVKFVLYEKWFGHTYRFSGRMATAGKYMQDVYDRLSPKTIKKLDYFLQFLSTDFLRLESVTGSTSNDGNYNLWRKTLWEVEE